MPICAPIKTPRQPELATRLLELRDGDHLCLFYERPAAGHMQALAAFIVQALESDEQFIYVADDQTIGELVPQLEENGVAVEQERSRGRLKLWTRQEWREPGALDVANKVRQIRGIVDQAFSEGFKGVRFAFEMTWTLGPDIKAQQLERWEAMLNTIFVPGFPGRIVCLYNRSRLGADVLVSALHTHPLALLGEQVCTNPFYQAPLILRAAGEGQQGKNGNGIADPRRFDWMVSQLLLARRTGPERDDRAAECMAVAEEDGKARRQRADVLEGIGDPFMIVGPGWNFIFVNRAAAELLGKPAAAVVGTSCWDVLPDARGTPFEQKLRRIADERISAGADYFHLSSQTFYEVKISPAGDGTSLHFRDVSENRRSLALLHATQREMEIQIAGLKKLHDLGGRMLHAANLGEVLDEVLQSALSVHGTHMGVLSLCSPGGESLAIGASSGFAGEVLKKMGVVPSGKGACGSCLECRERVIIDDVEADPLFEPYREVAREAGFRAVHSTPLITREGRIIGVLSAHFPDRRRPSQREMNILDLHAAYAANAIEAVQLREQAQQELRERHRAEKQLALQCSITYALADATSLAVGGAKTLQAICEADDWDAGAFWLVDAEAGRLRCLEFWSGPSRPFLEFAVASRRLLLAKGCGMPGRVWEGGEPVYFPEIAASLNLPRFDVAKREGLRSAFGFPVRLGADIIGAMEFYACAPRQPAGDFLKVVDAVGLQVGQFVERKRAELARQLTNERLRTSEERFRLATSNTSITLYEQGRELRYTWLYPDTPENRNALGKTDGDLVAGEDGRRLMALKSEVMATGLSRQCEARVGDNGSVRFFDLFISPKKDADGNITGVAGAALDVTARMQAENASLRLAAIVESSEDAIVSKNLDGTIMSWNKGAERLFGYTAGEIVGRSILTLIPEDRRHEEPAIVGRMRRGERIEHVETIRRCKDGRLVTVSVSISPIRDRHGKVVGASKIARDVTTRRRTEQQQQAVYELAGSVNRAEALPEIYNAALDAICRCQQADRASILLCDEAGVMRFKVSRGLSERYRRAVEGHSPWAPSDLAPQPVWLDDVTVAQLPPALREEVLQEGIRALAFVPLTYEKRLIGKFMLYYDTPHAFSAEELHPVEAIASQVAFAIERQKSSAALEALVAERTASLRQAIAQMEEFSYSVSHDLRAPLRAMQGYATALIEDYEDRLDPEGREYLHRIVSNSTRMDNLIQDTLTYTRMNNAEIQLQPVFLDRLVREIVQQYPEMQSPRAYIAIPGLLPAVMAHEPSLSQAISNLLNNAVKFVDAGVTPEVTVHAEVADDQVRLLIDDNGIGIRPEHQHRIFGMFERIHPANKYEGTGIGLAIVRKAVERMGGLVGFESDGIRGCRFWIQLPAAPLL